VDGLGVGRAGIEVGFAGFLAAGEAVFQQGCFRGFASFHGGLERPFVAFLGKHGSFSGNALEKVLHLLALPNALRTCTDVLARRTQPLRLVYDYRAATLLARSSFNISG
jgi:hypothetical protein